MSITINPPVSVPLSVKVRMCVARIMAMVSADAKSRRAAEVCFREITRNQSNLIAMICLSFAGSKEDFEDLRQDALLNIWRGIGSFRRDSSESTWVYRVTLNSCISSRRKLKSGGRQTEAHNEFYRELFEDSSAEEIERYELMYRLISRLSPLDKSVLLMWLDEKPYDEIAEVSGLSRNAVASRLKRAKERLATMASEINE